MEHANEPIDMECDTSADAAPKQPAYQDLAVDFPTIADANRKSPKTGRRSPGPKAVLSTIIHSHLLEMLQIVPNLIIFFSKSATGRTPEGSETTATRRFVRRQEAVEAVEAQVDEIQRRYRQRGNSTH